MNSNRSSALKVFLILGIIWITISWMPCANAKKKVKSTFCNPDCGRGETSGSATDLQSCNCIFYQYIEGKLTRKSLIKSSCKVVTDRRDPCYKLCKRKGGRKGTLCIDRCFCVRPNQEVENGG